MSYELKDGNGSLFINKDKAEPTDRDRAGDCKIDGVEYWISGWIKKTKNGDPFLSLSFKPKVPAKRKDDVEIF